MRKIHKLRVLFLRPCNTVPDKEKHKLQITDRNFIFSLVRLEQLRHSTIPIKEMLSILHENR